VVTLIDVRKTRNRKDRTHALFISSPQTHQPVKIMRLAGTYKS
jgi:hypothetical protein